MKKTPHRSDVEPVPQPTPPPATEGAGVDAAALRDGEQRFRALSEAMPQIVWSADASGTADYLNRHMLDYSGAEPNELIRWDWGTLIHPDDLEPTLTTWQGSTRSGQPSQVEHRLRRADGEFRWHLTRSVPLHDAQGNVVRWIRTATDIHDQKLTEAALEDRVRVRTAELARVNADLEREIKERRRAETEAHARAEQQTVVARLGQRALGGAPLAEMFQEAAQQVAQTLHVEFSRVLELLPSGKEFLLRAGVGWKEGLVGQATVGTGVDSQAGYVVLSGQPVIVDDLRTEQRFGMPLLLREHGVVSGLSVIISGETEPFGVLGAHTTQRRAFTQDDIHFLQAVASVLAVAIEREQAHGAARRANAYNRNLIEAALDPLVTIGPDGRITGVNTATEAATGRTREELVGTDFSDYFTDPDMARAGYQRVFREGFVRDYPLEIRHTDGRKTPVLYNASVYRDDKGEVIGVFAAARDVTERQRAEAALRAERQRFRNVLDQLPAYLVLLSQDYGVPFANRFFEERFGKSDGRRCHEYLFGRPEPCESCESFRVLKTNAPHCWEWTGPDGRIYEVHDFPFTDVDGSTLIMEVGLDVTGRKKAEAGIHAASRYARSLIEVSLDPLVTISPAGKITDVNRATELVTGITRAELIGTDFSRYFTEPQQAEAGYQKVLAAGFVQDYPLTIRHADGRTTDVLYNAAVYRNEAGAVQGVFAAARDITERKRAETELARYREHLEELVRQRSGELAAANAQLQAEVAERTRAAEELRARNEDLTRFNRAMVDRELRMIELKKEVNELCLHAGQALRYRLDFEKERP